MPVVICCVYSVLNAHYVLTLRMHLMGYYAFGLTNRTFLDTVTPIIAQTLG